MSACQRLRRGTVLCPSETPVEDHRATGSQSHLGAMKYFGIDPFVKSSLETFRPLALMDFPTRGSVKQLITNAVGDHTGNAHSIRQGPGQRTLARGDLSAHGDDERQSLAASITRERNRHQASSRGQRGLAQVGVLGEGEIACLGRRTRERGGRVIAVGTTVVRALESAVKKDGLSAYSGETDIFIQPGYKFAVVDAMITNFHLPESSLLMLVSAFHGTAKVLAAYRYAVAQKFRFFSYGDAMFLERNYEKNEAASA